MKIRERKNRIKKTTETGKWVKILQFLQGEGLEIDCRATMGGILHGERGEGLNKTLYLSLSLSLGRSLKAKNEAKKRRLRLSLAMSVAECTKLRASQRRRGPNPSGNDPNHFQPSLSLSLPS